MAHYVIFFVVVSLASIQSGSCLKCYQCDSQVEPESHIAKCNEDGYNNEWYLMDCNDPRVAEFNTLYLESIFPSLPDISKSETKACHKIVFERSKKVVRTCLGVNISDVNSVCGELFDISKAGIDESTTLSICTACTNEDRCNGAGSIMASLPLALITATVSYLYYKH